MSNKAIQEIAKKIAPHVTGITRDYRFITGEGNTYTLHVGLNMQHPRGPSPAAEHVHNQLRLAFKDAGATILWSSYGEVLKGKYASAPTKVQIGTSFKDRSVLKELERAVKREKFSGAKLGLT